MHFAGGPPATGCDRGSVHNLQLDIMDDIVQAKACKARLKLWNTSSEKVCEVQTLDEAGGSSSSMRYTNNRRYSDFVGTTLAPIQSMSSRRASENPSVLLSPCVVTQAPPTPSKKAGIVCTNTDLISLLSSLASSATEINRCGEQPPTPHKNTTSILKPERKNSLKKSNRSNSFDVSILKGIKQMTGGEDASKNAATPSTSPSISVPSGWFAKRHQPVSSRRPSKSPTPHSTVTFAKEAFEKFKDSSSSSGSSKDAPTTKAPKKSRSPLGRLKWDGRSALVDARLIGSAIEGFLRRDNSSSSSKGATSKESSRAKKPAKSTGGGWFSKAEEEDSSGDACDTSLCATLKDLFVK